VFDASSTLVRSLLDSSWTLVARRFSTAWLLGCLLHCRCAVVALSLAAFAAVEVCSTQVGRAAWLFVALSSRCCCTVVALLLAAFAVVEVCSTQVGRLSLGDSTARLVGWLAASCFSLLAVVGGRFTSPVRRSSLVEDNRSYEKDERLCTVVALLLFALSLLALSLVVCRCRCRCRCLLLLSCPLPVVSRSCLSLAVLQLKVCSCCCCRCCLMLLAPVRRSLSFS
jgi:hypothetical protein